MLYVFNSNMGHGIALVPLLLLCLSIQNMAQAQWSWDQAASLAPPVSSFANRGSVTIEQGEAFAAPGAPDDLKHLYGVLRYRDASQSFRSYDLYFSPSLAIWKFRRLEAPGQEAQYVGGFHYSECSGGQVTATDRVIQPAVGLNLNYSQEAAVPNTTVRSNYGCPFQTPGFPWPVDNYQGAGSGRGIQPDQITDPIWDSVTQTLFARVLPKPWVYYDGVLNPNSPEFLGDFPQRYDMETSLLIQSQIAAALDNVQMEIQIRIYPDGTIMLSNIFTDLKGRPWVPYAIDGEWVPFDSAPNGRVFYTDLDDNFIEPFAGGANPQGVGIPIWTMGGWVGYMVDTLRTDFGIGYYCGQSQNGQTGLSIFPSDNWPGSPSVLATNHVSNLPRFGGIFRQGFLVVGTKEEMRSKAALLNPYARIETIYPPSQTHTVSPGLGTLQAAIDAAGPGDVLELLSGDYDGDITIDKALTFRPAPDAEPRVRFTTPGPNNRPIQTSGTNSEIVWEDIPIVFNHNYAIGILQAFPYIANARMILRRVSITEESGCTGDYGIYQAGGVGSNLLLEDCTLNFRTARFVYTDVVSSSVTMVRCKITLPSDLNTGFVILRGKVGLDSCVLDATRVPVNVPVTSFGTSDSGFEAVNTAFQIDSSKGVGLHQTNGIAKYQHCTFVDRRAGGTASSTSLFYANSAVDVGSLTLRNCLFGVSPEVQLRAVVDTNGVGYGVSNKIRFTIGSNHLASTQSTQFGTASDPIYLGPLTTGDPLLAPDGIHLLANSPAIDGGPSIGVGFDIDGDPRPLGLAPDFGADEYLLEATIEPSKWTLY